MDDLFTYGGQEGMLGVVLDNNFDKLQNTLFIFCIKQVYGCMDVRKITMLLVLVT